MKAYTRRRLVASAKLGLAAVPLSVVLRLAHGLSMVPGTFIMGFGAGFAVGVAELVLLRNWLLLLTLPTPSPTQATRRRRKACQVASHAPI